MIHWPHCFEASGGKGGSTSWQAACNRVKQLTSRPGHKRNKGGSGVPQSPVGGSF